MISVSCIIPHYNDSDRIVRAIDSCLEQENLEEILIVDDGSSPQHHAGLDDLTKRQRNIRVVRLAESGGPAQARNFGAAISQAKLICFLDSDDEYLPGFFSAACGIFAARPHIAAVECGVEVVNQDLSAALPAEDPRHDAISFCYPCNMILRRDVFFLIGGFPTDPFFRGPTGGEDIAFKVALARYFDRFLLSRPYSRYYWKKGAHLDRFLDRTKVIGREWKFAAAYPEERDGEVDRHRDAFLAQVEQRLEWSKSFCRQLGDKRD